MSSVVHTSAWWQLAGPLDHWGTAVALAPVLILETSAHYCVRNSLLIYGTQPQLLKSHGGFENSLEFWAATFPKALKAKKEIEVIAAHGTPSRQVFHLGTRTGSHSSHSTVFDQIDSSQAASGDIKRRKDDGRRVWETQVTVAIG